VLSVTGAAEVELCIDVIRCVLLPGLGNERLGSDIIGSETAALLVETDAKVSVDCRSVRELGLGVFMFCVTLIDVPDTLIDIESLSETELPVVVGTSCEDDEAEVTTDAVWVTCEDTSENIAVEG
jgi:hypothetical protein